jgi:DNA polymerase elongation subunit (family B)
MILKFAELVYTEDPTFITGFNDSAFDWPFLKQKIEYYGDPDFYCGQSKLKKPKTSFLLQFTKAL